MPRLYEDKNPVVVRYIREALDFNGIEKVWHYLSRKFGFNIDGWSKKFQEYLNPHDRDRSYQEQFMQFGKMKIEPLLNEILCRDRVPTWINLLAYLLRDKIEAIKKRNNFYGRK